MMIKMHLCMINIPVCMFLVQILFKHSVYEFYLSLYMFMGGYPSLIKLVVASSTPVGGMGT